MTSFFIDESFPEQIPNVCAHYLPGRAIVRDTQNNYYFFPLGEIGFFHFGEMIEASHLIPIDLLTEHERETLHVLRDYEAALEQYGLHAVRLEGSGAGSSVIVACNGIEDTFYRIAANDLSEIDLALVEELHSHTEPRELDNPYCVQLDPDEILVF